MLFASSVKTRTTRLHTKTHVYLRIETKSFKPTKSMALAGLARKNAAAMLIALQRIQISMWTPVIPLSYLQSSQENNLMASLPLNLPKTEEKGRQRSIMSTEKLIRFQSMQGTRITTRDRTSCPHHKKVFKKGGKMRTKVAQRWGIKSHSNGHG